MPTTDTCECCSRPFAREDAAARRHYDRHQRSVEERIEEGAKAEAERLAQRTLPAIRAEAKKQAIADLKKERADEVRAAKARASAAEGRVGRLEIRCRDQEDRLRARERRSRDREEAIRKEGREDGRDERAEEFHALRKKLMLATKQADDFKRRLESMSPQDRGDFQEDYIEGRIKAVYGGEGGDQLTALPRRRAGDRIARVRYFVGSRPHSAESILIESKNEEFQRKHLDQIVRDGRTHDTDLLLLVVRTFPAKRNSEPFFQERGVLVVRRDGIVQGYGLLRELAIERRRRELSGQAQREKTAELLRFLDSREARGAFEALVRAGADLDALVARDRAHHQTLWRDQERLRDDVMARSNFLRDGARSIIEAAGGNARPRKKVIPFPSRSS